MAIKADVPDLFEFDKIRKFEQARKACRVCNLPEEVRERVRVASEKKISKETLIEWLNAKGHRITEDDLREHRIGAHEDKLRRLTTKTDGPEA